MDYSRQDFTGQSLVNASDLNGQTIIGSNFSQAYPDTKVFPENMIGVTFINCNLDNCYVPEGNTVQGGTSKRIEITEEGMWVLDEYNNRIEQL